MTPKQILIAASSVLVALVAVLIVALSRSGLRAAADTFIDSNRERAVRAADVLDESRSNSEQSGTRDNAVSKTPAPAERLPSFAESTGLRIVVLSSTNRTPVPAADVRVWEHTSEGTSILMSGEDWIGPDFEAFMNASGGRFVTDLNGECEMPRPGNAAYVSVRREGEFGWTWIDRDQSGLAEIEMIRPHSILARVRDRAGVPQAGIRVAFGSCDDGASQWEAPSNSKGEVRLPAVEVLVRELGLDNHTPFALRLCIPEQPRIEQWFTLADLPTETVEFTLPATGSVRVTIVDELRQIVPVSGTIQLKATYEDTRGRPRLDSDPAATKVRMVDGVALFTRVGVGLQFDLEADMPGTGDAGTTITGPTDAGETVEVEVAFDADHTLLTGRLLDENGSPLANQTFDWRRVLDDDQSIVASGRDRMTTDSKGCFRWTLRRSGQATGPSTHRTGYLCELGEAGIRRQATVSFAMEYTSGITVLGDIVMRPSGPLVAGRVVDEHDSPVPNAIVSLRLTNDGREVFAPTFDPVLTASDGSFDIFGPCLTPVFSLHVEGPLILTAPSVPFVCSSAAGDIVIQTVCAGGLEGTAWIDHDASIEDLVVSFTYDGQAAADRSYAGTRRVADRVYFEFIGEKPGIGTVGFHVTGDDVVGVFAVPRITIESGRSVRVRSLIDVDLRGKLPKLEPRVADASVEMIEFEIVDSLGRAIPRGVIAARGSSDERGDLCTFGNGRARIHPDQVILQKTLEIWAPGCRVTVLSAPFTARRIVLDPELEVEFKLDVPRSWRAANCTLLGFIAMRDVDPPQFQPIAFDRMQPFRFDSQGRGSIGLPCGGAFAVYVSIRRKTSGEGEDDYGLALVNDEFRVRDTDGRQVVELVLDPEGVKQCNEDLGLK